MNKNWQASLHYSNDFLWECIVYFYNYINCRSLRKENKSLSAIRGQSLPISRRLSSMWLFFLSKTFSVVLNVLKTKKLTNTILVKSTRGHSNVLLYNKTV